MMRIFLIRESFLNHNCLSLPKINFNMQLQLSLKIKSYCISKMLIQFELSIGKENRRKQVTTRWPNLCMSLFFSPQEKVQRVIYIMNMNRQGIKQFILRSGIGLDARTLEETLNFLEEHIGFLQIGEQQYEALAAAALKGETIMFSDTTSLMNVRSGITLEHVMRHTTSLSKEKYLEVLTRQISKWREAPHWLKVKTDNLKINYRIYKKYRNVLEQLSGDRVLLEDRAKFNLMAIFWILYLLIKHQNADFDNTVETIQLLHSIVIILFSEVLNILTRDDTSIGFKKHFSENPISEEIFSRLREKIQKKLCEVHAFRYNEKSLDLRKLVTDINYSQRFLDDISNIYGKLTPSFQETTIDQLAFLELSKTLTPLNIVRKPPVAASIQKKIDFSKSDDEDECNNDDMMIEQNNNQHHQQETHPVKMIIQEKPKFQEHRKEPPSPFRPFSTLKGCLTPLTTRQQNLSWTNGITSRFSPAESQKAKRVYELYAKNNYMSYRQQALAKIRQAISQFTPDCMDIVKRQTSIYHFFEHFVNRISESHQEAEKSEIFYNSSNFNSILCLAVDLFNYAYQSLSSPYRKYCRIFDITLLEGHRPINWFGRHAEMPRNIQSYLYDLQKKILIEQIWQDNEGYTLLISDQQLKKYHNQALIKRLFKHVTERTQQLCDKMKIEDRQVMRIVNLVRHIIQKNQILLYNHKIDQIIVCAIASILSINRSRSQFSLEEIFAFYNQMLYSFYSNRSSLFDTHGNQIDLIIFYNNIFLPSLEKIINSEDQDNILATPIRLERKRSQDLGIQMTPIARKFKQAPTLIVPSRRLPPLSPISSQNSDGRRLDDENFQVNPSYRSRLANSLRNINSFVEQLNEEDEQEPSSPTFGGNNRLPGVFRTFSFGQSGDKI